MFLLTRLCSQIHDVIKIMAVGDVSLTSTALVGSHATQTQISGHKTESCGIHLGVPTSQTHPAANHTLLTFIECV